MIDNEQTITLPDGYLSKRRKLNTVFIFTIYLFCLFKILVRFGLISFNDSNLYMLTTYLFYIISLGALIVYYSNRTMYNKIKMINHNKIKAFTNKEKAIFILPIMLVSYFIVFDLIYFILFIGIAYLAVDRIFKPVDVYDKSNFR